MRLVAARYSMDPWPALLVPEFNRDDLTLSRPSKRPTTGVDTVDMRDLRLNIRRVVLEGHAPGGWACFPS